MARRKKSVRRHRKANPSVRRRHTRRGRRNPSFAGVSGNFMTGVGVLVGMTATKMVTGLVPSSLTSTPLMRLAASAVATYAVHMAAARFVPSLAQGILYGGLAQTGAIALNAFVPSVAGRLVPAGLGDIIPGSFVVPQNPVLRPAPMVNMKPQGVGSAFGSAF